MKTATITWITHNNYGTLLQAYALQQCLQQMGVQNDIVSDHDIAQKTACSQPQKPITEQQAAASSLTKMIGRLKKYILHPAALVKSLHSYHTDKQYVRDRENYADYQKVFDAFKQEYIKILPGLGRQDMASLNEQYDAFLCGSDQIWSVLDKNFDGYYYLDFVTKKKISYAASVGTERIDQAHQKEISAWLQDFAAISVREKETATQLSEFTQRNVNWVCDPTLLHNRAFWTDFCSGAHFPSEKYVLCYFLTEKSWYYEYAKALAKYLHLKLLQIPATPEQLRKKECYKDNAGPIEFVSLIQHAQYVLTDSYHGSIFSMLFEKDFLYLKRFQDTDPAGQNIRIFSLFEKVGLTDRIIEDKKFEYADMQPIDYQYVTGILKDFRHESRQFLLDVL